MTVIAARVGPLSPFVHAVDDGGALCGARPRGGWRMSRFLPINCPACLLEMSKERYAFCETPVATSMSRLHIRQLGPDGLRRGGVGQAQTLCGKPVGWDVELVADFDAADERVCAACRVRFRKPSGERR